MNAPRALRVDSLSQVVDVANAAVYKSGAAQLIRETIGIEPRYFTFVIHVARFSDGAEIVKQNWYVFHSGVWTDAQFATANRIYGRGQVWFLYIQLNARSGGNATYTIQTRKKSPAYFDHLQSAAGLFGVSLAAGEPQNIWNAKLLTIPYLPSEVAITPAFGGGMTFINEGLSWVEFGGDVRGDRSVLPSDGHYGAGIWKLASCGGGSLGGQPAVETHPAGSRMGSDVWRRGSGGWTLRIFLRREYFRERGAGGVEEVDKLVRTLWRFRRGRR